MLCWECYNCVKICPTQAVEVRSYADFVPLGASATPLRSTDSIMWTVKFRNGNAETLQVPHPHYAGRHCGAGRRVQDSQQI